jgi:cob(I)alamin adenosyltransferase
MENNSKIYTKIGDQGRTYFFGCGLVHKDDPRIESFGAFDELNSLIGLTLSFVEDQFIRTHLTKVQHLLFQVCADLGSSNLGSETLQDNSPFAVPRITEAHLHELEHDIDLLQEKIGLPKSFVLPSGTRESTFLHLCRSVTRRAERTLVTVKNSGSVEINPLLLKYVNRLSDFFYMLARYANKESSFTEQQPIYHYFKEN